MSRTSKQITVELIPVLAEIHAHPGDHIMVLDGKVIGVSTERVAAAASASHKTTRAKRHKLLGPAILRLLEGAPLPMTADEIVAALGGAKRSSVLKSLSGYTFRKAVIRTGERGDSRYTLAKEQPSP